MQTTARQGRTSFGGMPKSSWAPPKGMRGKCERRGGNINADGAGAEVFAGDGCSQGASFGPMALISRRGQGGRIYNNTRTRERLRRKCVKPADLTTHSPSKICSRPRTATRTTRAFSHSLPAHFRSPSPRRRTPADLTTHSPPKTYSRLRTATRPPRALPPAPAAQTHTRRLRDTFLAAPTTHSPPKLFAHPTQRHALPEHFRSPTQCRRPPAGCAMHARRLRDAFPAEDFLSPPHSDTPSPSTFDRHRSANARPQAVRCIPRRPHNPFPPKTFARPRSADARPQAARCIPLRPHHPFPAAPPCLPLRSASGTKKRHRTVHVRCRMSRSTVVAVGHWGW